MADGEKPRYRNMNIKRIISVIAVAVLLLAAISCTGAGEASTPMQSPEVTPTPTPGVTVPTVESSPAASSSTPEASTPQATAEESVPSVECTGEVSIPETSPETSPEATREAVTDPSAPESSAETSDSGVVELPTVDF